MTKLVGTSYSGRSIDQLRCNAVVTKLVGTDYFIECCAPIIVFEKASENINITQKKIYNNFFLKMNLGRDVWRREISW